MINRCVFISIVDLRKGLSPVPVPVLGWGGMAVWLIFLIIPNEVRGYPTIHYPSISSSLLQFWHRFTSINLHNISCRKHQLGYSTLHLKFGYLFSYIFIDRWFLWIFALIVKIGEHKFQCWPKPCSAVPLVSVMVNCVISCRALASESRESSDGVK